MTAEQKQRGYLIETGSLGRRAILTSEWSQGLCDDLLKEDVQELELNDGKGWRGSDVSFVRHFVKLLGFKIIDLRIKSVAPIHVLHGLRSLDILTYCQTELHFGEFPHLIECGLEWRPKATSLFERVGLRKLYVNRYAGVDADPFGKLVNLDSLTLLGAPFRTIVGLRPLAKLRSLRLGDLRRLETLAGLEALSYLEKLEINTCPKIGSLQGLEHLTNLQELHLNNIGSIQSLGPIASLRHLRVLTFYESTNILDGDLSPILNLPRLERVSFQNRRHYTHSREDFQTE